MGYLKTTNNPNGKIAVVLDEHVLFAESFSKILESLNYFSSVVFFPTSSEVVRYLVASKLASNVYFFLDYYINNKTVLPFINDLRRICKKSKISIISGMDTPRAVKNLLDYNVDAIIHKSSSFSEVISCFHHFEMELKYYSTTIQEIINEMGSFEESQHLTARELQIIEHFSTGLTVDETAKILFLSRHTVAAHRRKIFLKTGSNNIAELLSYVRRENLL